VFDSKPSELGMVPAKEFLYKYNSFREPKVPRKEGTRPLNLLAFPDKNLSEGHWLFMTTGSGPVNEFVSILTVTRFVNKDIVDGNVPNKELPFN
jgi:hypothetical protein